MKMYQLDKSGMVPLYIRSPEIGKGPVDTGELTRPPDKSAYWKIIFFISHVKHMLWVLKEPSQ